MFGQNKNIIIVALCTMLFAASCDEPVNHKGRTPLVSVDKEFLYHEDVNMLFSANRPAMDSVVFVKKYVQHWLEDVLLYRMARHNVADTKEIERLVDSYKKALFLNIYQERLIEQQLECEVSDADISDFYEQNKNLFLLDRPMVQGLFLKVAKSAPRLATVRKWHRSAKDEDLENLEKYCVTNAQTYDYFMDSWQPLSLLAAKVPLTEGDLLARLERDDVIEFSDSASVYMINIVSLLRKGEQKPLDIASGEIRELLVNTMKANFIKEVKKNLYNEALLSGDIKIYDDKLTLGQDSLPRAE